MAEKVEIDIPGIGLIEAKNAASEATLQEILKVLEATKKLTEKNQKATPSAGAGGGGGAAAAGAAAAAAASMGASLSLAGKAVGGFGKALGLGAKTIGFGAAIAGAALGGIAKVAMFTANTLVNLGNTAVSLTNELANMEDSISSAANVVANALGSLPGILGRVGQLVGSVFTAVSGAAEKMAGAYNEASKVGATFGGSLNELNAAASAAGMTMKDFASLVSANAKSLVYLGGTTEAGARRFADLSKNLRSSNLGAELQRMGMSTADINNGMAQYLGMIGKTGALQNMSTQQLAKSSAAYLKDLDALARLTGESREQQQQANDALMADAQFRAAMLGKDEATQKAMMAYINSLPEQLRPAAKEMIATGQITSEAGSKFAAVLPNAANQAMAFGRQLKNGGKLTMDQSLRARSDLIAEAKVRQNVLKDQALFNTDLQNEMLGAMNAATSSTKSYAEIQREQAKAAEKENLAQQVTKFRERIAEISNNFTAFLANSGMLDTLANVFEKVVGVIQTFVIPAMNALFSGIQSILPPIIDTLVPIITTVVKALFSIAETIFNTVAPIFTNTLIPVFTEVASAVSALLTPAINIVANVFKGLSDTTGSLSTTISGVIEGVFPVFNSIIRGGGIILEGLFKAVGYVVDPLKRLASSVANLFGGTQGLTSIFLHIGNIVGTVFEYAGVVVGGVIDVFSFLIDIVSGVIDVIQGLTMPVRLLFTLLGDVAMKFDFLRMVVDKVGIGFDFLKMMLSPAGLKTMFSGLSLVVGTITDFIGEFIDGFKGMLAELLIMAGKILPGIGEKGKEMKKEVEESTKAREEASKERKAEFDRNAQLAKTDYERKKNRVEEEKKGIAQDKKNYEEQKRHLGSMATLNKSAEDAKKKEAESAAGPGDVDMSSPLAMLESFSRQQGGFFADRIDQARQEQKVRLETDAANKQMADAEMQLMKAKTQAEKEAAIEAIIAARDRLKAIKEESKPGMAPAPSVAPTKLPAGSQIQGLGAVAAHFEAGGKAGTVSTGHGDFGGKSYGAFQLSSKTGDVQKFLEKSGYAAQFKGMEVGSKEFDAKWKELGATKEFAQAQATHAKSTHYDPQMAKLAKSGLDMSGRGAGVQEAIMSTANQYGANTDLIIKALKDKDTSKMSDKDIINAIQDYKAQTVQTRFKSSSAAVQAGVAKRIEQERAMLLGVEGGAPTAGAAAKPAESKPGKEPTPKIDPKLANDWAYSIFIGKNTMSQVPKPYLDEVGKILAKPPANWAAAPKTDMPKIETAKTETAQPPEQKPVTDVKTKPDNTAVKNWAYAVFEGKISLGQVPLRFRDQVAEMIKNPPADWTKAPAAGKETIKTTDKDSQAAAASTTPTNEEFKINGKKVSKEEFDAFMKANPQAAQMMDMAKNMAAGKGLPGSDMMQKMGGMLPIGSDVPGLTDKILGPNVDPNELFKSQLANLGEGAASYELNGKSVTKEEFDKAIQDNPALKSLMSAAGDPMASLQDQLGNFGADASAQVESILGPTSALTNVDSLKNTMAEDAAARMAQEAEQRKAVFESLGRTDAQGQANTRSGRGGATPGVGGKESIDPMELLNNKLEKLIAINQNIANVNNDQLRVQKSLNFSGDVYNSAG